MQEEIFGPVLTVYVYDAKDTMGAMQKALHTAPFGLTAAIFAREEAWLAKATEYLKNAGGNFYINDKSTGAVVAQQPFGGSRISGESSSLCVGLLSSNPSSCSRGQVNSVSLPFTDRLT